MRLTIFWTEEAKETFDLIIKFLENEWSIPIAAKFAFTTYQKINLIATYPYLFKASISKNIRQAVISKHNSMFYEVYDDRIVILFFIDNRQEPII